MTYEVKKKKWRLLLSAFTGSCSCVQLLCRCPYSLYKYVFQPVEILWQFIFCTYIGSCNFLEIWVHVINWSKKKTKKKNLNLAWTSEVCAFFVFLQQVAEALMHQGISVIKQVMVILWCWWENYKTTSSFLRQLCVVLLLYLLLK